MENTKNSDIFAKTEQNPSISAQMPSNFVAFPSFPPNYVDVLLAIKTQMAGNHAFLDLPNCPYSDSVKQFLREIFGARNLNTAELEKEINDFFGDKEIYHRIIVDSKRAYMNLANQMTKMETAKNLEDALSFSKALTGQMERLLIIQEKAEGLKNIHEFKMVILDVIANELTPDQRTGIMNRLEDMTKA